VASAARSVSSPTRAADLSAFLRSDGSSGTPGRVWSYAELGPHVLDEPAQRRPGVVDQRDHPPPAGRAAGAPCRAVRGACRTGPGPT
jgi:hypothetical protein